MQKYAEKASILQQILENKSAELKKEKRINPLSKFFPLIEKSRCEPLEKIFPEGKVNIIGEIKRKSPFGRETFLYNPDGIIRLYEQYCRAASVLTDERHFGGNLDDFTYIRTATDLPLLRKDFIIDEYQIYESRFYGADMVLIIASILPTGELADFLKVAKRYNMHGLVEVHDEEDLQKALETGAKLIGINNRNLATGEINLYRTIELAPRIPNEIYVVSESGIKNRSDIEILRDYVDGFLIGRSILESNNPEEKLKELTQNL